MRIFDYDDYRAYLAAWVGSRPNKGYGQLSKLAKHLGVSSVFVTQVGKGDRDLNLDQALDAAEFMQLSGHETDYFLLLVQIARVGSHKLKSRLEAQRKRLIAAAAELKTRVPADAELSPEAKAIFYGHWHFTAVRLMTSIPAYRTLDAICAKLQIPRARGQDVLAFLESNGLVARQGQGWKMGPRTMHLESGSPFVVSRQVQWRTKGFEAMSSADPLNLFYTGAMSLDAKAFAELRETFARAIEGAVARVKDAPAHELACLNIDLFKLG